MLQLILFFASFLRDQFRSRASMQTEILALRHQLGIYQRTAKRLRIRPADRVFWSWLSRVWSGWRESLVFVRPETIIAWRRRKFREHWRRLIRSGRPGRPAVRREVRDLIRRMSSANPLWGAPHIVGELAKIGIDVTKSTVEKYMVRRRKPPSATWRTFLKNHIEEIIAVDFFMVPTVRNQVLFVFLILAHERRRVLHFNVTANPTARWAAQQMVETFPWTDPLKYLLRDRDKIYGESFRSRVRGMGIEEILTAARSPWQSPFVERLNELHLLRILRLYFHYYHEFRVHQALEMDCPESREVHSVDRGPVVEIPEIGGLHHHYERAAA
jgi:putative transposase